MAEEGISAGKKLLGNIKDNLGITEKAIIEVIDLTMRQADKTEEKKEAMKVSLSTWVFYKI